MSRFQKLTCSVLVICFLLMIGVPTSSFADNRQVVQVVGENVGFNRATGTGVYSKYWQYWSQGASKVGPGYCNNGCFFIAQSKMLVEAGIASSDTSVFNPDEYYTAVGSPTQASDYSQKYASGKGTSLEKKYVGLSKNNTQDADTIMNYLRDGWLCILHCSNVEHFSYVLRGASLDNNTPVISDSYHNCSWWNGGVFKMTTGPNRFDGMHAYRIPDSVKPTISNVVVSNITGDGYTVSCRVSDNKGVKEVMFPTWTEKDRQDDLAHPWPSVAVNSGANEARTVTFRVKVSDHNLESGKYITHIYVYDKYGNYVSVGQSSVPALYVDVPLPSRYWQNLHTDAITDSNVMLSAQFVQNDESVTGSIGEIISGVIEDFPVEEGFYLMAGKDKTAVRSASVDHSGTVYWKKVTSSGNLYDGEKTIYGMSSTSLSALKNESGTSLTVSASTTYYYKWVYSSGSSLTESAVASVTTNAQAEEIKYAIVVDGCLDNIISDNINGYGLFDLYIDGALAKQNIKSYNERWPDGTSYEIKNIRWENGRVYAGTVCGSLNGSINGEDTLVRLAYDTCASLTVDCSLDGVVAPENSEFVTFDVYVQGAKVADDVSSFKQVFAESTVNYEIKDIQALTGHVFESISMGQPSGTISRRDEHVRIALTSSFELTDEWQEIDAIPGGIDYNACEIQINNHYVTVAEESPGEGWEQAGLEKSYYVDDGAKYTNYGYALPTSSNRVLIQTFYYHYCDNNSSNGNSGFSSTAAHSTYHPAGAIDNFTVISQAQDPDDTRMIGFLIRWKSGQWAGGQALCPAGKGYFYRAYEYQNRKLVNEYKWIRSTGWTDKYDEDASYVTYRIRRKNVKTVTLNANGGRVSYPSVQVIVGELNYLPTEQPFRQGYKFVGWSDTQNGAGNTWNAGDLIETAEDITLYAQWCALKTFKLPDNTLSVQDEAFLNTVAEMIIIPDGCERIEQFAFAGIYPLAQVVIPDTVIYIASNAFSGSAGITILAPAGSTAEDFAQDNNMGFYPLGIEE